MRLRWTVVVRGDLGAAAPGLGNRADVLVQCPSGTTLAQVTGLGLGPGPRRTQVSVSGQVLDVDSAEVGSPPLLDGAVLVLSPPGERHRRARSGGEHLLELVVLAGPDTATVHPLLGTRLRCGRGVGCDVVVHDPRMSREHCELVVEADGVRVRDLGSTNGTTVLGPTGAGGGWSSTDPDGRRLALGEECVLGASLVTLRATGPGPTGVATTPTGEGTLLLGRSPRVRLPEPAPVVRLPAPARAARSNGFPVLAVVLPAAAAGGLALWTGSPVYLLLAALGPLLVAGGWFTSRRDARRDGLLGRREHARACALQRERARGAAEALAVARAAALPDADVLLRHARSHGHRVWERDPGEDDAFRVRLGLAHDEGAGSSSGPSATSLRPYVLLVDHEAVERPVTTAGDLVSVDLRTGALGLVESGDVSLTRFVVGQLVTLLPAGAMRVVPLLGAGARDRWGWLHLLPHVLGDTGHPRRAPQDGPAGAVAGWLAELVEHRCTPSAGTGAGGRGPARPLLLVVVDDPDGDLSAGELAWLPDAAAVGVHVVVVAPTPAALPRGCATVAVPAAPDGVEVEVSLVRDGSSVRCVADRVGPWWSERLARHLAPLRAVSSQEGADLPDRVPLTDLLGTGSAATLQRWSTSAAGLPVPLGVGREGLVVVDLVSAGPHALVAGTTGSGKSELLRAWLLAIALCHPPEHVALLLVDYKGGATFEDLSGLPHTVGLLTDLDGGATARVLHSLRAEVRRRERLLAAAGARDLGQLRQTGPGGTVPRLLVVVDEFRVLAEDAPDVLAQFVRLAATGRSLGLHLVLATQRPAGVVSADIRANTGLRIALRVQDAEESRDVVDRPDAARLPHDRPGRAVVVGAGVDHTLQAAWVGDAKAAGTSLTVLTSTPSTATAARPVTAVGDLPPRLSGSPPSDGTVSAAARVVAQVRAAASASDRPDATSPWLPPLPARLGPGDVTAATDHPAVRAGGGVGRAVADGPLVAANSGLVLGLTDLPWLQSRGVLLWEPLAHGPALVLGGPRSGRSSTLQVMADAAAGLGVPVVRLSGGGTDGDHTVDLLGALAEAEAAPVGAPGPLQVLLLVDDCDALLDPAVDPEAADLLVRVLRTGHRGRIGVALAGGRASAVSRLAAGARVRLVHRTTDAGDAVLAGVPVGMGVVSDIPGRCLVLGLPDEGGTPGEGPGVVEAQVLEPRQSDGASSDRAADIPSWLVRSLPGRVEVPTLGGPSIDGLPVGLVSPDGEPWLLRVGEERLLAVVGPARSGRSTALRTIQHQADAAGVPTCLLPDLDLARDLDLDRDPDPGRRPRTGAHLLLVDDLERCDPTALHALETWLVGGTGPLAGRLAPGATVVVAGLTEWFAGEFRGVPAAVRRHGSGVVLRAGRTDVRDVLACREPVRQRTQLPGRGILVQRGRARRIQVAVVGTTPATGQPVTA